MLGREVRRLILEKFPSKQRTKLALYVNSRLMPELLDRSLQEEGMLGRTAATLSCTYVPIDLNATYAVLSRASDPFIENLCWKVSHRCREHLTSDDFNASLERVTFPSSLHSLSLGYEFDRSLEGVNLPMGLQSLTLTHFFNKSLSHVTLPEGLKSLSFGGKESGIFNQNLEHMTWL